jgi:glycerol uptake facilitator-like aquaporin
MRKLIAEMLGTFTLVFAGTGNDLRARGRVRLS